jgi:alginate O-acetyltransferase complex protein AlgI
MLFCETMTPLTEVVKSNWKYFAFLGEWMPLPFFHTFQFLVFVAVVLALYWSIPKRKNAIRTWLLVVASFNFYAAWSAELAFLVAFTATIDYLLALALEKQERIWSRRLFLILSIGMNLGILCYFKYANFFLDSLAVALKSIGVGSSFQTLQIIVPFGISFYTFEAISYTVDVYNKKIKAERSLPNFLLFILFFPHLVSGPIVRAGDFLPQVRRVKHLNWLRMQTGVQLFLLGLFKKIALADRMALFCDPVWREPEKYSEVATWLAVLAYAYRIYFDFSGYSDMAVGAAHLLGFKLTQNFNLPYLSTNVSEFWRNWHISLSSWLRDYLFIPLGGSRGSNWITHRNLMITMLLGGLWHGATWSFVVWGGLHALFLIVHRMFQSYINSRSEESKIIWQRRCDSWPGKAVRILLTFACVSFAWIFFRKDLAGAMQILQNMFTIHPGLPSPMQTKALIILLAFVLLCHWLSKSGVWLKIWPALPAEIQGFGYACCVMAAMILSPDQATAFIYFDF